MHPFLGPTKRENNYSQSCLNKHFKSCFTADTFKITLNIQVRYSLFIIEIYKNLIPLLFYFDQSSFLAWAEVSVHYILPFWHSDRSQGWVGPVLGHHHPAASKGVFWSCWWCTFWKGPIPTSFLLTFHMLQ